MTESPYGEDAAALGALLRELGAGEDEIPPALRDGTAGPLALDLALRSRPPTTAAHAAAEAGLSHEDFSRVWQALGFPPVTPDAPVPSDLAAAAPVIITATHDWLGDDAALGIARVIGSTTARIAEAIVDAFRVRVEVPELTGGRAYSDIVRGYVEMTRIALPGLDAFIASALRAHLVRVAAGAWSPDDDRTSTRRELFVGFVDLVGYTALSRALSSGELAALLRGFEGVLDEVIGGHGGRLVKLIGDGALFVADDPARGCAIALELAAVLDASDSLPPARVGADHGSVLTLAGDYFGEVVNRAARFVALAAPGTVVVGEPVAERCAPAYRFERLPTQALKGFGVPAVSFRLLPG